MTNPRGVFSLRTLRLLSSRDQWVDLDTVWVDTSGSPLRWKDNAAATSNYGYYGGGEPGSKSIVDRIDYSNDTATASPKGPLSLARYGMGATGNSSFGYFGGGSPSTVSTIDRIDYSNDTATASPKGPLSAGRYGITATGNNSFGYFGGGGLPSPTVTTVDRVDYSNDTATASVRGPLNNARRWMGAVSARENAGGNAPVVL